MGLSIPLAEDISLLSDSCTVGDKKIPNRLAAQPMEGCDGTADGKPGELTLRRYRRFAEGGAGLIWFEATAVVHEGRANPRQLYLSHDNINDFRILLADTLKAAENKYGSARKPYTVLQLTHSGRYSMPGLEPGPIIAVNNPYLDKRFSDEIIRRDISDNELGKLEDSFADAAVMAEDIGFDAVDIKSCHGYLNSELLTARMRLGDYGGSFENRTRFLMNVIDKIQARTCGELEITLRLTGYDALPYPYGWGVNRIDSRICDPAEPVRLVKLLSGKGLKLINISAGNPYYNPHIGRPYDSGNYIPPEHPLAGIERILNLSREIQQAVPGMAVVATGFSWLREFGANCAAGGVSNGWFSMAGFGRQVFAYPDFADDIITQGGMKREKCCIACGKCTEIMRFGGTTGCVIRDDKVYRPIYKQVSKGK